MDNSHTTHAHAQRFLVPGLTLIARTVAVVSGCSPQHSGQEAAVLTHRLWQPGRQLNCVAASGERNRSTCSVASSAHV